MCKSVFALRLLHFNANWKGLKIIVLGLLVCIIEYNVMGANRFAPCYIAKFEMVPAKNYNPAKLLKTQCPILSPHTRPITCELKLNSCAPNTDTPIK